MEHRFQNLTYPKIPLDQNCPRTWEIIFRFRKMIKKDSAQEYSKQLSSFGLVTRYYKLSYNFLFCFHRLHRINVTKISSSNSQLSTLSRSPKKLSIHVNHINYERRISGPFKIPTTQNPRQQLQEFLNFNHKVTHSRSNFRHIIPKSFQLPQNFADIRCACSPSTAFKLAYTPKIFQSC